jgi:hypothetical protein
VIANEVFRGPVVRVRMLLARARCGCGPGGPRDECDDLARDCGIFYGVGSEPAAAHRAIQDFRFIVPAQILECAGLRICPGQHVARGIIAVVAQLAACPLLGRGVSPICALHFERQAVHVVGVKSGPRYAPWPWTEPYCMRP